MCRNCVNYLSETVGRNCFFLSKITLVFKGYSKFCTYIYFAFHTDVAPHAVNVVVHQIKSNSLTVNVIVEFLVQAKNLVFNYIHVKSKAIILKNQLVDSVCFSGRNRNDGQTTRHGIFDGIRD